jgi:hypothetical protein
MMSIRRLCTGETRIGSPAALAKAWFGRLAVVGVAGLALFNVGGKKDLGGGIGGGRRAQQAATPAAANPAVPAMPTTLTKGLAIDSLVNALTINQTPAAEKTLEQMVMGQIAFGGHSKQASQMALLSLATRSFTQPTPELDAFFARIFSDPDDQVRPGDTGAYPAAELRNDAAHVLARVGSPGIRLALAKIYTQPSTPEATRNAIERVIRGSVPANFAAQVEVFRGAETPEVLKSALEKNLLKQNEAAVKAALKLASDEKGKPAAGGGSPFGAPAGKSSAPSMGGSLLGAVGKLFGGGASSTPSPAAGPFGAMASINPAEMQQIVATVQKRMEAAAAKTRKPGGAAAAPVPFQIMSIEILGEIQKRQPADLGLVAKDLWTPEFVETISKALADNKGDAPRFVNALASVPTKASREKLRELLHKQRTQGPEEFAKMETVAKEETPAAPAGGRKGKRDANPAGGPTGRRGGSTFAMGGMQNKAKKEKLEVAEFGTEWYDPGSLVVLKSVVPYAERPPEKPMHRTAYPQQQQNRRMSAAMEKRLQEREEKKKAAEATYDWRDAIEKAVRQWDERLAAVAEEPANAGDKPAAEDDKKEAAGAKPGKAGTVSAEKKAALVPPAPAVAMPFTLSPGETIAKEYHQRWPQDLAANFGNSVPSADPMLVDYVRLEEKGQMAKTLTHYDSAIKALKGTKPKFNRRKIENGVWLDAVQKDETSHRTRSIDIIVTKEQGDDDAKKSGDVQVTVEILLVEIDTPGGDAFPSHGKKESPETTSTSTP